MSDLYPSDPIPSQGVQIAIEEEDALSEYPSGHSVGIALRQYGLFTIQMGYKYLTDAERDLLRAFHRAQRGRAGTFLFADIGPDTWTKVYVGVGDGVTVDFDLPAIDPILVTIRKAGVELVAGVDFTLASGGGANGRDRITLTTPPAAGAILECDFTGRLASLVRFVAKALQFVEGEGGYWSTTVQLKGTL